MSTYIIRRLMLYVPTLIGISLAIFLLLRALPGDIAEIMVIGTNESDAANLAANQEAIAQIRHAYGLDQPLPVQYVGWVANLAHGDFGVSFWTKKPVGNEIQNRLPLTTELCLIAIVIAILLAIPMGVISSVRSNSAIDYVIRMLSLGGLSIPSVYASIMLILFLVVMFKWLPPLGVKTLLENPGQNLQQLMLPSLLLAYELAAVTTRMTRSAMLEVVGEDYVRTARAKGLARTVITLRHQLPNALVPVITLLGLQVAALLGGSVIIETVFGLPGMGTLLVGSIQHRDYPTVQAIVLLYAVLVMTVNLMVDIAYARLDPRIRLA